MKRFEVGKTYVVIRGWFNGQRGTRENIEKRGYRVAQRTEKSVTIESVEDGKIFTGFSKDIDLSLSDNIERVVILADKAPIRNVTSGKAGLYIYADECVPNTDATKQGQFAKNETIITETNESIKTSKKEENKMTTYFHKVAKNGRNQYFRIGTEGKKKMVKREEYEANITVAGATETEEQIEAGKDKVDTDIKTTKSTKSNEKIEIINDKTDETNTITTESRDAEIRNLLDFVKSIVEKVSKRKFTFKDWKTYASVYYRGAMICGFELDENKIVTSVKFMGTTHETRKTVNEIKIESQSDFDKIKDLILSQIEFINWWCDNPPQAKTA